MNRLRDLRDERGMTLAEVGAGIGASSRSVGYYERGERGLTDDLLIKFCRLYGVTADYILGLSLQRTPSVSDSDTETLAAYHAAPADIRAIIDTALAPYKKENNAESSAS